MAGSSVRRMVQPDEATRQWALSNVVLGAIVSVQTTEVVEVVHLTGLGIEGSPLRQVKTWWLPDGTKIGEDDPCG